MKLVVIPAKFMILASVLSIDTVPDKLVPSIEIEGVVPEALAFIRIVTSLALHLYSTTDCDASAVDGNKNPSATTFVIVMVLCFIVKILLVSHNKYYDKF